MTGTGENARTDDEPSLRMTDILSMEDFRPDPQMIEEALGGDEPPLQGGNIGNQPGQHRGALPNRV